MKHRHLQGNESRDKCISYLVLRENMNTCVKLKEVLCSMHRTNVTSSGNNDSLRFRDRMRTMTNIQKCASTLETSHNKV